MAFDASVFYRFVIAALATWRLAFLLARERGPWDVLGRFRRGVGTGTASELLKCVKCVGLWVAVPFAFFVRGDWCELIVIWLALAGATALIDEWTRPPFEWQESKEGGLAMLDNRGDERVAGGRDDGDVKGMR